MNTAVILIKLTSTDVMELLQVGLCQLMLMCKLA